MGYIKKAIYCQIIRHINGNLDLKSYSIDALTKKSTFI